MDGTFWLFCGISLLGFIWLFFVLPETKNKTLEEVEELFMSEEYRNAHKRDNFHDVTKDTKEQAHSPYDEITEPVKQDNQYDVISSANDTRF
ncbi:hypothetical protein CHS0354_029891 [Potamilus streckersoni]|uniref:Major facilitator superfamily (MFS) profile domain-containing protein n=1 Tax=Potamilus streckersoni TaxID=2493646 RepID=A0AAE0RT27_9BIVA|nr:hypothetical protein CHS0354_029891 [Potamilus streckersoni]